MILAFAVSRSRAALCAIGLVGFTSLARAQAPDGVDPPVTAADAATMLQVHAVTTWFDEPGAFERGLCAVTAYRGPWPLDGAAFDARAGDRLRREWERCASQDRPSPGHMPVGLPAPAGGVPPKSRLVAEARTAGQEFAARILGPYVRGLRCRGTAPGAPLLDCMTRALGRNPNQAEIAMAAKVFPKPQ